MASPFQAKMEDHTIFSHGRVALRAPFCSAWGQLTLVHDGDMGLVRWVPHATSLARADQDTSPSPLSSQSSSSSLLLDRSTLGVVEGADMSSLSIELYLHNLARAIFAETGIVLQGLNGDQTSFYAPPSVANAFKSALLTTQACVQETPNTLVFSAASGLASRTSLSSSWGSISPSLEPVAKAHPAIPCRPPCPQCKLLRLDSSYSIRTTSSKPQRHVRRSASALDFERLCELREERLLQKVFVSWRVAARTQSRLAESLRSCFLAFPESLQASDASKPQLSSPSQANFLQQPALLMPEEHFLMAVIRGEISCPQAPSEARHFWLRVSGVLPWDAPLSSWDSSSYDVQTATPVTLPRHQADLIHVDVDRGGLSKENQERSRNILTHFCHHVYPYVQGMSDLVEPFVVLFEDPDALILYTHIMKQHWLRRFDQTSEDGVQAFFRVLRHAMQYCDCELWQHISALGADDFVFCFQWAILNFKRDISMEEVFVLWPKLWCLERLLSPHVTAFIATFLLIRHRDAILKTGSLNDLLLMQKSIPVDVERITDAFDNLFELHRQLSVPARPGHSV